MRRSAFWMALAAALLFGAATPLSKPLLDSLSGYQLAGLLYLGASLGVLGLILRKRGGGRAAPLVAPWRLDRINGLRLLGSVLFGGLLGPLALLAGLRLASASAVSVWLNLELVATALLGQLFFRDHLTRRTGIAAVGILLAALLMAWEGNPLADGTGGTNLVAVALVAGACLSWGMDNHLTALIDGITPEESTFWKGLVAGGTNLAIGLAVAPLPAAPALVLGGLALGALSYGLSIVLYISAAQQLGATRSQLLFSSAPFWGVLLSILLLGEAVSMQGVVALIVLGASLYLLTTERHRHPHRHAIQTHEHLHAHDAHHAHGHDADFGGASSTEPHSHAHVHDPLTHTHAHEPDLHHRHEHEDGRKANIDGHG